MASGGDSQLFQNISATTAAFALYGGTYGITATATWGGGNIQLQTLSPDGSTWIAVMSAVSANSFTILSLPPGQYQFQITTATAVYAAIARINL